MYTVTLDRDWVRALGINKDAYGITSQNIVKIFTVLLSIHDSLMNTVNIVADDKNNTDEFSN